VVPLGSATDLWEVSSDMTRVGERLDGLRLGAPGALRDRAIDGGRPTCTEWLLPRPRFALTLSNGGIPSSGMRGLMCALEVERRRRSLSGVPAAWNVVLIALRDFLDSLLGGRTTGGGLVSRRGPGLPLGEKKLVAREKSRLRVEDGEEGAVDSEDTERGMATVFTVGGIRRR